MIFNLLEQASTAIESHRHQTRSLKSEKKTIKQLVATIQDQILVEIQKAAILSSQMIATKELVNGMAVDLPWDVLTVLIKPLDRRTKSDVDLLDGIENKALKGL